MVERNERPLYEGNNRRVSIQRKSTRRRSDRYKRLIKYAAIVVITVLAVKLFHL